MAEMWDLVDRNGELVGIRWSRKNRADIPCGWFFPCVEVWVKVEDRLLITRRHPEKSEGLKFDVPGGAALSGEGFLSAAVRELKEEVGISVGENEVSCLGRMTNGSAFAVSYILKLDSMPNISLQKDEVVDYMLITSDELESMTDQLTEGTYRRYLFYKDKLF